MTITLTAASKICTKQELELVRHSTLKAIKDLTPFRLQQKISRARKLRDKYRSLARQQKGEARGKRDAKSTRPAQGADNTKKKAELFDEAMSKFQAQLEKLERQADRAAAPTTRKSTAKKTVKKSTANKSPAKKTTQKSAKKTAKKVAKKASTLKQKRTTARPEGVNDGVQDALAGRQTRRQSLHASSVSGREKSRFSRTSQQKIQGHVSASGRRNQARRDSKR